jgi:hypothetical protein
VAQIVGPEFYPQYGKTNKQTNKQKIQDNLGISPPNLYKHKFGGHIFKALEWNSFEKTKEMKLK